MSRRLVTVVVGIGAMAFALAGCFGNGPHPVGNGDGLVGPGLYRTLGDNGGPCAVTRYDASNTPHFYSNATGGPIYLRLKADDTTVTSANCMLWQAAFLVPPIFAPGADFVSGDYRVNYEVMPGTYQASGTSTLNCHWERVSDFVHDGTGIIAEGTVANPAQPTVQISATDFGFTSQNCGTWHRTGA